MSSDCSTENFLALATSHALARAFCEWNLGWIMDGGRRSPWDRHAGTDMLLRSFALANTMTRMDGYGESIRKLLKAMDVPRCPRCLLLSGSSGPAVHLSPQSSQP